ncbi:MAG: host attachment protein [Alphaproteobacteria bacterium]|nr:host attachment protein [Alphaproteobacteria bacterium]
MKMLIVADSGRARFYELDDDFENLTEAHDLVHPEARLRASDVYEGDPHTDRKDVESEQFARQVADQAKQRLDDYDGLHIVAPPRFLGQLRKVLSKPVQRKLVGTLAKDLTQTPPHELQKWVRENR